MRISRGGTFWPDRGNEQKRGHAWELSKGITTPIFVMSEMNKEKNCDPVKAVYRLEKGGTALHGGFGRGSLGLASHQ